MPGGDVLDRVQMCKRLSLEVNLADFARRKSEIARWAFALPRRYASIHALFAESYRTDSAEANIMNDGRTYYACTS